GDAGGSERRRRIGARSGACLRGRRRAIFRSRWTVNGLPEARPRRSTRAVFFDVDFTLIHPGPAFQGHGYADACARYGVQVDAARFETAVAAASATLHNDGGVYDPEIFIDYTRRIIEGMGGSGPGAQAAAR